MKKTSFPQYSQASGWNKLLPARRPNPSLDVDYNCELTIVGAGYTGISAAKRWRQLAPDDEIVIIDSSEIGEGNPGRNSGFVLEIALANDADPAQMKRMSECNQLIAGAMEDIARDVKLSNIDCQLDRTGTYRAAAGEAGMKALMQYRNFLEAAELPFEDLDKDALSKKIGTRFYRQGLYSPHCYLAQPASLIKALASQLPEGVRLFENTGALRFQQDGDGWIVETRNGLIRSKKLILANNAFAKELGVGKSRLVAMYTYAGITPVLGNDVLQSLGSDSSWGILPSHRLGSTLRKTVDGRLLVRSFYGYEKESRSSEIEKELSRNLTRRFPQLESPEFESVWGGAVGFTLNGGGLWGEVKPGLFVSAGCNGGGIVKGTLLGKLLAEKANGNEVPNIDTLFGKASWMPPEPFRAIGFKLASSWERYRGKAEL
ncbi:MAG: FAD-binding oxidoreductase [Gammaproteobacteria bacterium]|nr:FAD-binding oxidoreductase [Gammaproteobacteria bacterium]MBT3858534.1 FAD-binding oxidoreductase [Gammaproteobacteria bacterium]MBT3986728.1 FAD-binding oxidoreductase [Gammaproteobacteria bacterium]MBT4255640.1 FAD-binding oxidoreductase [Gammaproteobacteria bacterium]MBT4582824.1 FAD-binding oxidoreductase [Gammaproteobacteria bacterium]